MYIFGVIFVSLWYLGFGGDAEAEQVFKMENKQVTAHQNKGYVPPLRRKQEPEENGSGFASQFTRCSRRFCDQIKIPHKLLPNLPVGDLSKNNFYISNFLLILCVIWRRVHNVND